MSGKFESHSPGFIDILGDDPNIEHLATGFNFTEGPVWREDHLLFSDIPQNRIIKYHLKEEGPELTSFRFPSGNANGLTLDEHGQLIVCEHGNRRVTRTNKDGSVAILAARHTSKRLNSPNDVVVSSTGVIYFTDPPYGLIDQIKGKELDFQGVFRLSSNGDDLSLVDSSMKGPNGLALSPNEQKLYVADSVNKQIVAFSVDPSGKVHERHVFAELKAEEEGVPDGIKIDTKGNLYSTGPGGIWIFNPDGVLQGRIVTPEVPANCAWGDSDWRGLYITARTGLYKIRLAIPGIPVGRSH